LPDWGAGHRQRSPVHPNPAGWEHPMASGPLPQGAAAFLVALHNNYHLKGCMTKGLVKVKISVNKSLAMVEDSVPWS